MQAATDTVASSASHAIACFALTRNHHSPLTSLHAARSTAITASMSATVVSFITPGWPADYGAARWRRFLSATSRTAATFGFDTVCQASIAAKWWSEHGRAWVNAAIGC